MRNVILLMGMGLDGFSAEGWFPDVEDEAAISELYEDVWEELKTVDTFLFGRVNYKLWERVWPPLATSPGSSQYVQFVKDFSKFTNRVRKVVFSKTLKAVDWENSSLVNGNIPKAISKMKSEPGKNMAIVGGAGIAQTFAKLDLIDEYHIYLHPTIIGKGKPLLGESGKARSLKLTRAKAFKSGVVGLHLQRPEGKD